MCSYPSCSPLLPPPAPSIWVPSFPSNPWGVPPKLPSPPQTIHGTGIATYMHGSIEHGIFIHVTIPVPFVCSGLQFSIPYMFNHCIGMNSLGQRAIPSPIPSPSHTLGMPIPLPTLDLAKRKSSPQHRSGTQSAGRAGGSSSETPPVRRKPWWEWRLGLERLVGVVGLAQRPRILFSCHVMLCGQALLPATSTFKMYPLQNRSLHEMSPN